MPGRPRASCNARGPRSGSSKCARTVSNSPARPGRRYPAQPGRAARLCHGSVRHVVHAHLRPPSVSKTGGSPGQAAVVAFGVIVAFALFGQSILGYLGVELPAMQGAGGPHLLLVALQLLTPRVRPAAPRASSVTPLPGV
ncbi:MAG: MarC family protein [Micromonosporaceae bacterium]